jgi:predicted ester cyclase
MEVQDVLVGGDLACVRLTTSGTRQGDFTGIPPRGKRFEVTGFDLIRVRDGQVIEHWGLMDAMKMMQQLGAMPGQASA